MKKPKSSPAGMHHQRAGPADVCTVTYLLRCPLLVRGRNCVRPGAAHCCADMGMCWQVRMVDEAAERLRKRQRDEARASSAQQRTAASSAATQVRAQVRLFSLCLFVSLLEAPT